MITTIFYFIIIFYLETGLDLKTLLNNFLLILTLTVLPILYVFF